MLFLRFLSGLADLTDVKVKISSANSRSVPKSGIAANCAQHVLVLDVNDRSWDYNLLQFIYLCGTSCGRRLKYLEDCGSRVFDLFCVKGAAATTTIAVFSTVAFSL